MKYLILLGITIGLCGCAVTYKTASGSQWSVSADPDAKQIKFLSRNGF